MSLFCAQMEQVRCNDDNNNNAAADDELINHPVQYKLKRYIT